jgi:hypothetical protein
MVIEMYLPRDDSTWLPDVAISLHLRGMRQIQLISLHLWFSGFGDADDGMVALMNQVWR